VANTKYPLLQLFTKNFEGANSGIGYATAKVFASKSPEIHVIVAGRNLDACKTAVAEMQGEKMEGSLSALQLDVTNQHSVDAAAKQIEQQFGRLDVLINNAGIADTTLSDDLDFKQRLDQVLTTNVTGPAIVSRAFQPLLFKSKNAYSIYVSSGLASLSQAANPENPRYHSGFTVYRLSKTALNMWALQEFKELRPKGVKVFIVCPGLVRSNLRGKTEEMVTAGGRASDPAVSGETILNIVEGKRDQDIGKFVHKDGVYEW
jgi:NAD(P)-dependent dehydrogenase (short-subunit alcohol dehydrogenase family)